MKDTKRERISRDRKLVNILAPVNIQVYETLPPLYVEYITPLYRILCVRLEFLECQTNTSTLHLSSLNFVVTILEGRDTS